MLPAKPDTCRVSLTPGVKGSQTPGVFPARGKKLSLVSIGCLLLLASALGIATPRTARAVVVPADNLPPARVVEQTRAELSTLGCVESPNGDTAVDVPAGKPYRVAARDRQPDQLFFCNPAAAAQLTPVQGEVRGVGTQGLCALLAASPAGLVLGPICLAADVGSEIATGKSAAETIIAPVAEYTISWIVEELALLAADLGNWLLDKALVLITAALGASQFITNPLVAIGWPFIQGLANLGFIIALLFIAFATTLGIDNFGAKRMLPRLLIAAILINFSLVISGVLIDFAKLVMAILANIMGTSISLVDDQVKAGSGVIPLTGELLLNPFSPDSGATDGKVIATRLAAGTNPESAGRALATALIVWAMAIGVLWLAIGLLIRYIMLIFLLIISPLAYLAYAFPNADSFAKQWWQQFFKYVAYGPIALFFLAIASQLSNANIARRVLADPGNGSLQDFLTLTVMVAMMFAAAIMSKKLGGTFATAAINFTTGKAKSLGRAGLGAATFLPRKASQEIKGAAKKQVGGFYNVGKAALLGRLGIKAGDKPFGEQLGKKVFGEQLTNKQRQQRQDTQTALASAPVQAALTGYSEPNRRGLTQLQDQYPALAKIMRTATNPIDARAMVARDPKLMARMAADPRFNNAALSQHYAVANELNDLNANPHLSLENFANTAVTSGLTKEEIGQVLNSGNTQRISVMLGDINVAKNMDPADKAQALAGDFGEKVQTQVLAHVRELSRRDAAKA